MLSNIDTMVIELSRAEVDGRRSRNLRGVQEHLKGVNGAIATLEQWIMIAELIR